MEFSAETINELFVQKLDSKEGLDKVASQGSAFIRNKLREVSFARKIINPVYVTQADCQRSVAHDGLVKIVDIEPDSNAMVVNFRGKPDTNYIAGERFEVRFFGVSSEDFQKTEEELLAYEMPLTEVIEKNSVKDIQAVEDGQFMASVDTAVGSVGTAQHINGAASPYTLDSGGAIKRNNNRGQFKNMALRGKFARRSITNIKGRKTSKAKVTALIMAMTSDNDA